jgi:hypothetical protein
MRITACPSRPCYETALRGPIAQPFAGRLYTDGCGFAPNISSLDRALKGDGRRAPFNCAVPVVPGRPTHGGEERFLILRLTREM